MAALQEEEIQKLRERRIFRRRRRAAVLDVELSQINYKNVPLLSKFVSETGKIISSRMTGASNKQQKLIARHIKLARHMALMPYHFRHDSPAPVTVYEHVRHTARPVRPLPRPVETVEPSWQLIAMALDKMSSEHTAAREASVFELVDLVLKYRTLGEADPVALRLLGDVENTLFGTLFDPNANVAKAAALALYAFRHAGARPHDDTALRLDLDTMLRERGTDVFSYIGFVRVDPAGGSNVRAQFQIRISTALPLLIGKLPPTAPRPDWVGATPKLDFQILTSDQRRLNWVPAEDIGPGVGDLVSQSGNVTLAMGEELLFELHLDGHFLGTHAVELSDLDG